MLLLVLLVLIDGFVGAGARTIVLKKASRQEEEALTEKECEFLFALWAHVG